MSAPARSRDEFMDAWIDQLDRYWLLVTCTPPCQYSAAYPLKLMAQRQRSQRQLRDALPRLRCKVCGARPSEVLVTDDPVP